jgi:hypothetical protein
MVQTVEIVIEGAVLEVRGIYNKAEPDVGFKASFEIGAIYCKYRDDISNLIDWASSGNGFKEIEEKILEKLVDYEPDYEN